MNFDRPLGDASDLYFDGRIAQGDTDFRFAPSVGTFAFEPSGDLRDRLLRDPGIEAVPERLLVAHRFIGHGYRDWRTDLREHDLALGVRGRLPAGIGYDGHVRRYSSDSDERGDTFVSESLIQAAIGDGRYDLENPLSTDSDHLAAVRESGLHLARDRSNERWAASFSLDGSGFALAGGALRWAAGAGLDHEKRRDVRNYRGVFGVSHGAHDVLGSGGTSYEGERRRRTGFAEVLLPPIPDWTVALGARLDDYNDVGTTFSHQVSSAYRVSRTITLRGSWDGGSRPPSLGALHASDSIIYPYVCDTKTFTGPLEHCDRTQVATVSRGNPALKPDDTQAFSLGAKANLGLLSFSADWFRIEVSQAPARLSPQLLVDMDAQGRALPPGAAVHREGVDGPNTRIENPTVNSGEETVSGVDVQVHGEWDAEWADLTAGLRWLHLTGHEARVGGELQPGDPPRDRAHASLQAGRGAFTASWHIHAVSGHENLLGTGRYEGWVGHDLTLEWRDPLGLKGLNLSGGVLNIEDRGPSVDSADPGSAETRLDSVRGRTVFLSGQMTW